MTEMIQNQFRPDYAVPPGETLLEVLEDRGMSQAELAERTGRPKKTINGIIKGKVRITPDTALQFERALNIPASFWNNLQRQYDETSVRLEERQRLEGQGEWLKRFPLKAMQRLGWVRACADAADQVDELLRFFGVASPQQWAVVWSEVLVAYRKSPSSESDAAAVAAWLRRGEVEAARVECSPYDPCRFKEALRQIRALTSEPLAMAWPKVVELCAAAGAAVVLVPELPRTRVCGATRWLTPSKAIIQLSLRYKTDDQFWFTFFHEAGHIVLHGKRASFVDYDDSDDARTQDNEASDYARELLISSAALRRFLRAHSPPHISKAAIQEFAGELGVSPGIVVGRLQHDDILPRSHCNDLKAHLDWQMTLGEPVGHEEEPAVA